MNAEQTPDEVVARNIRTFTRFQQEVIVGGDFSAFSELVAPDAVTLRAANVELRALAGHPRPAAPVPLERETFEGAWLDAVGNRAEHSRTITEIHGAGDVVFARWQIHWVSTTAIHGIPPTGERLVTEEVGFVRFDDDGRIREGWYMADPLELFAQLEAQVSVTSEPVS